MYFFQILFWGLFSRLFSNFSFCFFRQEHDDIMVGSKASDIAKGLALIVEVAAIFSTFGFAELATTLDYYAFDEQFHNKNKTKNNKTVKQKQQPVVAAALSASLCRLSIR